MLTTQESDNQELMSYEQITAPLHDYFLALRTFFEKQVHEFEPEIQALVSDSLQSKGKMLRPLLVFCSGFTHDDTPSTDIVRAAAVIELVHQATLVHDDILDGAHLRHSKPTVARKYNSHAAVLLGDALFAHALKLASDFPTVTICRAVSLATRKACSGEIAQSFQYTQPSISIDDYYRVIELKTAELFRVSCYLGATVAGHDARFTEDVSTFGTHLGIAYQIFDDMADLAGNESQIGKTLGTDLSGGKYTLPLILLKEKTAFKLDEWSGDNNGSNALASLRKLLHEHNILEETRKAFDHQIDMAEKALSPHRSAPSTERLTEVIRFVRKQADKLPLA